MRLIKDICRICMQITRYEDLEDIDLQKLRKQALLPELNIDLFENHLICLTCISIFRTLNCLKGNIDSSNAFFKPIMSKWENDPNLRDTLFDLKTLSRFRSCSEICRICLKGTKIVAVYLYENSSNLFSYNFIMLMMDYMELELNHMDKTLNPILCHNCLQQIEAAYSFRKHLDNITTIVHTYLDINGEYELTREDLQDILDMWDDLEASIDRDRESPQSVSHSPYDEHNYSKHLEDEWETFYEDGDEEMGPPPDLTRVEVPPPLTKSRIEVKRTDIIVPPVVRSDEDKPSGRLTRSRSNTPQAPLLTRTPVTRSRAKQSNGEMSPLTRSRAKIPALLDKSPPPPVLTISTPHAPPTVTVKAELPDQDDEFHEEGTTECPDLTSFVKTEPEETHDQPPVLEFQGLCNYEPQFTIAETFSVSERCNELRTRKEKRMFLNMFQEPPSSQIVIKLPKLDLEELQSKNIPAWNKDLADEVPKAKRAKKPRKLMNILKQPSRNIRKRRGKFSGPPNLTPALGRDVKDDKKKPLDNNGKHFCKLCDFSSTKLLAIKAHETRHVTGNIVQFGCEYCEFKTTNKKRLRKHWKVCSK